VDFIQPTVRFLTLSEAAQRNWFSTVAAFMEALFCVVHISPGPVPRGTEAETLQFMNTAAAPRSLFAINGYIASALSYSKTQSITGSNKIIPRFFPFDVARILVIYLAIVRPLELLWANGVFGPASAKNYLCLVFVRAAEPMTSADFSNALQTFTKDELDFPMGLADYRQVIKVILRVVLHIQTDEDDEEEIHAIDLGFGHNKKSSQNYYGRLLYSDLHNLTSEVISLCEIDCKRIHRWMEGCTILPATISAPHSYDHLVEKIQSIVAAADTFNVSRDSFVSMVRNEIQNAVRGEIRNALQDITKPIIRDILEAELKVLPHRQQNIAQNSMQAKHPPIIVTPTSLRAIRELLQNPDGQFKSVYQAKIVELVRQADKHIIGILPTGGGKSAAFFGCSFLEADGITVVIAPFNALVQDLISEATRYNIKVATWPDKSHRPGLVHGTDFIRLDVTLHRLVLVSAHDVEEPNFLPWLRNLAKNNLVKRLVIDEAHEILLSQDYRQFANCLKSIVEVPVQLVFLSATLSPLAEQSLSSFFNISPSLCVTVRAPTPRREISYRFLKLEDTEAMVNRIKVVCATTLLKEERGIIFCNSYDDCNMLSEVLKIPKYSGQMTTTAKSETFNLWKTGLPQWIVATSGFGHGINCSSVRHILHFHPPPNLSRFCQETGRAGRDGKPALSETLYTDIRPCSNADSDEYGEAAMNRLLTLHDQCRRIEITQFFDGDPVTCSTLQNAQRCDFCEVRTIEDIHLRSLSDN
jgi:superfamily II DNA helicase RecQ